jgi:hypothetical protein
MEPIELEVLHPRKEFNAKRAIWILWPSFIVAGAAEALFFTIFDPTELQFFGEPLEVSRTGIYTIGFFLFWAIGAASAALAIFLERSPVEVNRCPLDATVRPEGCPKRSEGPQFLDT